MKTLRKLFNFISANISIAFVLTAFAIILLTNGCYNDNEEDLYIGSKSCDTTAVTYSSTLAPMFDTQCNSCHSGNSPSGNVLTDNYASVVENSSIIKGAINHESGYRPMPENGNKLSTCELTKFDVWINQGMPNN